MQPIQVAGVCHRLVMKRVGYSETFLCGHVVAHAQVMFVDSIMPPALVPCLGICVVSDSHRRHRQGSNRCEIDSSLLYKPDCVLIEGTTQRIGSGERAVWMNYKLIH